MRVLHYNWIDPRDGAERGGGVRIYLRALMAAQASLPGLEVCSLASGLSHDLRPGPPRWRKLRADHYEIVNSATLAPSHADFATPAQLADDATEAAFLDFLTRTGPYDIMHLHSLEGVPARVVALRTRFPDMRLVFSLHNYHPFCPQVNLWWHEQAHCADFDRGKRCAGCLPVRPRPDMVRMAYRVETALARLRMGPGTGAHDRVLRPLMQRGWRVIKRLARKGEGAPGPTPPVAPDDGEAQHFRARRDGMVALINTHCDVVLAVSDRTRRVAEGLGLRNVRTSYIGTSHARCWQRTAPRALPAAFTPERPLRLTYLGYMRRDKGFLFLLDALASLPLAQAACVHLYVAARRGEGEVMARMAQLHAHLAGLDWQDGYRHDGLDALLEHTDLGVVPPLWEDNLPQTALEMHARHIPLITSDRGGAQELGGTTALTFPAGNRAAFCALLARLLSGDVPLEDYWAKARPPTAMQTHVQDLCRHYEARK